MDPSKVEDEVVFDFSPRLRMYKSGRVERLLPWDLVPPSIDPNTGVSSKDVVIVPETGVSARLYFPKITESRHEKLPLVIYFHGGAFCSRSTFSSEYNLHLNSLVAQVNAVVVSVEYRLAPEYPLPIAFDDSWAAVQWVASHSTGKGPETWLNDYADFQRVYVAGTSAGANLAHNMAMRAREKTSLPGLKFTGAMLLHPFFAGVEPVGSELNDLESKEKIEKIWFFLCPTSIGCDDPLINPTADPNLSKLGCERVLVCVAEADQFRDRGWLYCEMLRKSGWEGEVEFMEAKGEGHGFHVLNPTCENAVNLKKRFASFINQDGKVTS